MVDVSRTAFDGDALMRLSSVLHESQSATRRGLDTAVPASLAGLALHASHRKGARELLGTFRAGDYPHLGPSQVPSLVDSPERTALLAESGEQFLAHIFGDKLEGAVESIAQHSGVSRASAHTLLGLAVPLVLDAVSKEAETRHLGVRGLSRFLHDQARTSVGASADMWHEFADVDTAVPRAAQASLAPSERTPRQRQVERTFKALIGMVLVGIVGLLALVLLRPMSREAQGAATAERQPPLTGLPAAPPTRLTPSAPDEGAAQLQAAPDVREQKAGAQASAPARPEPATPEQPATRTMAHGAAQASKPARPNTQPSVRPELHALAAPLAMPSPAPNAPQNAQDALQSVAQAKAPAAPPQPRELPPPAPPSTDKLASLPNDRAAAPASEGSPDLEREGVLAGERNQVVQPSVARELPSFLERSSSPPRRFELREISFKPRSATLGGHVAVLDAAAKSLAEHPDVQLLLEGHAEDVNESAIADRLSLARAETVKSYLVAHGVASERLRTVGFGALRTPAEEARHENASERRRVDLVVVKR